MALIENLFFMFGGVAVMMMGMSLMGGGLEKFAGSKMKKLLGKVTSNRFAGIGVGTAVTSIIQSSTATTVMLVGFVNIGLLNLSQATSIIMGANIGTTVTAHIVSLSGVGATIDIGAIAAFIGCVGVLMSMLLKDEKAKNIGTILGGLGILFVGLEFISTSAKLIMFKDGVPVDFVNKIFLKDHSPLLLILIGIIITALVHSSSTITSLMVVLASIGGLSFGNALFLALGSNIGTCVTAILSSAGTSVNAKRTAVVHLGFNTFGCLITMVPIWVFKAEITALFATLSTDIGQQIAIFHTLFNVIVTIILVPFTNQIVKLVCLIVKDKEVVDEKYKLHYIDMRMLESAPIAVSSIKDEIIRMSKVSIENLNLSINMLTDNTVEKQNEIRENEKLINYLNKSITAYLTKLMGKNLSIVNDNKVGSYYHVVSDIERVGDYAENIMEYAERLRKEDADLSKDAKTELLSFTDMVNELYEKTITAFDLRDTSFLDEVDSIEDKIDNICRELEDKHIERLKGGLCSASIGSIYLQTVSNLERVGDHITNVAFSIKKYAKETKN